MPKPQLQVYLSGKQIYALDALRENDGVMFPFKYKSVKIYTGDEDDVALMNEGMRTK